MNEFNFSELKWLIGQWEGIQGNGIYHEEWSEQEEDKLTGKAYFINKGEISNPEKLTLICREDGIFYIADVSHNTAPVEFKLIDFTEDTIVFSNPLHDFPQKITYIKTGENNLTAVIEAEKNGKTKKIEFHLKKIQ